MVNKLINDIINYIKSIFSKRVTTEENEEIHEPVDFLTYKPI